MCNCPHSEIYKNQHQGSLLIFQFFPNFLLGVLGTELLKWLFTHWINAGCLSVSLHVTQGSGRVLLALCYNFCFQAGSSPALADVFPFYHLRNPLKPFAVTFTERLGCVSYLWALQFGNPSSWSLNNALIVLLCWLLGLHFYLIIVLITYDSNLQDSLPHSLMFFSWDNFDFDSGPFRFALTAPRHSYLLSPSSNGWSVTETPLNLF